jgi:hypothetical protein
MTLNKAEDIAIIFMYEKIWQKHLKRKSGLKLVVDSGCGTLRCRLYNGCLQPYN